MTFFTDPAVLKLKRETIKRHPEADWDHVFLNVLHHHLEVGPSSWDVERVSEFAGTRTAKLAIERTFQLIQVIADGVGRLEGAQAKSDSTYARIGRKTILNQIYGELQKAYGRYPGSPDSPLTPIMARLCVSRSGAAGAGGSDSSPEIKPTETEMRTIQAQLRRSAGPSMKEQKALDKKRLLESAREYDRLEAEGKLGYGVFTHSQKLIGRKAEVCVEILCTYPWLFEYSKDRVTPEFVRIRSSVSLAEMDRSSPPLLVGSVSEDTAPAVQPVVERGVSEKPAVNRFCYPEGVRSEVGKLWDALYIKFEYVLAYPSRPNLFVFNRTSADLAGEGLKQVFEEIASKLIDKRGFSLYAVSTLIGQAHLEALDLPALPSVASL